jgi:HD-GYP domain-containing protein (c-di-GMP phosphodiesterase class II)
MLHFETKDYRAHSQYGQLLFENLSLLGEMSKVVLYHHTDHSEIAKSDFSQKELASYLHLAETMDIFNKQLGSRFSPEAFKLFCRANEADYIFAKINSGAYKEELTELMEYFILTNEEKEKWMEFLMFTLALKSDAVIGNAALCVALCEKLGELMRLSEERQKNLLYAAYLHDLGYLSFRKEWIENPTKLSDAHIDKLAHHTVMTERLLKDRVSREVIAIAAAHHERADGEGYPRKLPEDRMNPAQLILQFADAVSTMMVLPADVSDISAKVRKQAEGGALSKAVTAVFLERLDEIAVYIEERTAEILAGWNLLNEQYAIPEVDR